MRTSAIFALALPVLAAATAIPRNDGDCNTGDQLCCNTTQTSTSTTLGMLGGLLGLVLPSLGGLIGFNCGSIQILGIGGNSCTQQPVCCTNNQFNGLIALGCTPININL